MNADTPLVPEHPTPHPHGQLIADLGNIIEFEASFRAACDAAVRQLEPGPLVEVVEELAARSVTAMRSLDEHVRSLGGIAPDADPSRQLLDRGADFIGELHNRSRIAESVQEGVAQLAAAYDRALAHPARVPTAVLACVRELRSRLSAGDDALSARIR